MKESWLQYAGPVNRLITTVVSLLSCLFFAAYAGNDELVIATGGGSPYIVVEDNHLSAPSPGFSIEIIKAVAEKLDWQVRFEVMPFSRQLAETEHGNTDALMAVFKSDAPHFIYPSQQIGIASNCFFKRVGSDFYFPDRKRSLDRYRIGVTNGFTYGLIDEYSAENIVTLSGEDEMVVPRLVKMLKDGRIDAFIEAEAVVSHYLKSNNIQGQVKAGCTSTLDAYIGFSPNNPKSVDRARQFDNAVDELRQEGRVAEILSKYNVQDWR